MGRRHQVEKKKKKANLCSVKHKASHSHTKNKNKRKAEYCFVGKDKEAIRNLHDTTIRNHCSEESELKRE